MSSGKIGAGNGSITGFRKFLGRYLRSFDHCRMRISCEYFNPPVQDLSTCSTVQ